MKDTRRIEQLSIRVTADEKRKFENAARLSKQSVAAWCIKELNAEVARLAAKKPENKR